MKKVLITAGGTGGHVFPALSVSTALIKHGYIVNWVGAVSGIEANLVPKNNIPLQQIAISGLRNKRFSKLFTLPFMLSRALWQAYWIIRKFKPNLVISFGGYASFPVALMAKILGIPLVIHEQNSIAGLTNRFLAMLANRILVAYNTAFPKYHTVMVGNPVRNDIAQLQDVRQRYQSRSGGLRVLVLGGSLGAQIFNENLPQVFGKLSNIASVVHQVGRGDDNQVKQFYAQANLSADMAVKVVKFIDNIAQVYSEVDLVICRSGALTVSELCVVGVAAIFVPYPYAVDNHQQYNVINCMNMNTRNSAIMLLQQDFTIDKMVSLICNLTRDDCLQMALHINTYAINDSETKIIAQAIEFL